MPESPEIDLAGIKEKIAALGAKEIVEKPIAFGLRSLEVLFIVDDKSGPAIEDQLRSLSGIASVETLSVTLV
jgi:translation elongation factor aEF-1 beta